MTSYNLNTLSPLDGRYLSKVKALKNLFSESSLIKHRLIIEVLYLTAFTDFLNSKKRKKLNSKERKKLLTWLKNTNSKDFKKVLKIQNQIKHDVKSVEYFLKENLKKLGLKRLSPYVHWGLTSADINNLSYSLMIQKAKDEVLMPQVLEIIKTLLNFAAEHKNTIMPGRTHGQIALPTTFGKEFLVYVKRLAFFYKKANNLKLHGKLTGAVGTLAAHKALLPQKDWLKFSHEFVKDLGLKPNLLTTQIEPGASLTYFFSLLKQISLVLLDLSKDCWYYISLDYLIQKINKKEVGSSTMPHKINPIKFENAEGNLKLSISFFDCFSQKLSISRLQRDLSDSTVKRNIGVGLGHFLLSLKSLEQGLKNIKPNKVYLKNQVKNHPEMLGEALQLLLKLEGRDKAYEKIKQKIRGRKVDFNTLLNSLDPKFKRKLKNLKAEDYIGYSSILVIKEIKQIKKNLNF
jgi:adenylosuccinate lyase